MSWRKIVVLIVLLASVAYAGRAFAGPNADAVLSLDLIADAGTGNGRMTGSRPESLPTWAQQLPLRSSRLV